MRHQPALVHRIAVKAPAQLIVDAAARHLFQRGLCCLQPPRLAAGLRTLQQQIDRRRMREFWPLAESPVTRIEALQNRGDQFVHKRGIPRPARARKRLRLGHGIHQAACGLLHFRAPRAIRFRNALKHAPETRTAHGILRRKVRAAVKWPSIGQQKACERPSALSRHGVDRRLVPRVHIRPLVAIHLHRHK